MPGPARAGLFVYAVNLARLAEFYQRVLGIARLSESAELVVLEGDGVQLIVHQIPDFIAATITITSPPERRGETALKFFFTVPSIADAGETARSQGGSLDDDEWEGSGFRVRNAVDPEGNVFQVRERTG